MDPTSIEIRPLVTPDELQACIELQQETWGEAFSDLVPASILKVSQRIGGVALGAFDAAGAMLGFVFGLTGIERGEIVHWSDMLAVRPEARNLGIGRKLKEQQRRIVRELGASVIYWTFDPLVARNAHLNFNRLGVRLVEYAEDMYGITDSTLHGSLPTDRLVVAWPTEEQECRLRRADAERASSSADARESPVVTSEWIGTAASASILPHCVRIAIPTDVEPLLAIPSDQAGHWRQRVRRAMQWTLARGYTIRGFQLDDAAQRGYYLMAKSPRLTPANHHS
jgi:predicted GNAT superfamily acetyltransferase